MLLIHIRGRQPYVTGLREPPHHRCWNGSSDTTPIKRGGLVERESLEGSGMLLYKCYKQAGQWMMLGIAASLFWVCVLFIFSLSDHGGVFSSLTLAPQGCADFSERYKERGYIRIPI